MIYLDYAATTPLHPQALDHYQQAAQSFYGNSSSLHDIGGNAERLLERARQYLMQQLAQQEGTVIFTGSGSEANYIALTHLMRQSNKSVVLTLRC